MFVNIITRGISNNGSAIVCNCSKLKIFGSDLKGHMKENHIHMNVFEDLTVLISLLTSVSEEYMSISSLTM
jgi:hypothetical protein